MSIALSLEYNENKFFKYLDYWSGNILNFDLLWKGLGIVFSPDFVKDFSRKMSAYLIVWLSLLPEILCNMFIANIWLPGCDIIFMKLQ